MALFSEPEWQEMQRQIDRLRATVNVLERTIDAHATMITLVQAKVDALARVRLT